jgi:hypothetical protein
MYKIVDDILKRGVVQNRSSILQILKLHHAGNNNANRKFVEHKSQLHSYPEGKSFTIDLSAISPIMKELGIISKKLFN